MVSRAPLPFSGSLMPRRRAGSVRASCLCRWRRVILPYKQSYLSCIRHIIDYFLPAGQRNRPPVEPVLPPPQRSKNGRDGQGRSRGRRAARAYPFEGEPHGAWSGRRPIGAKGGRRHARRRAGLPPAAARALQWDADVLTMPAPGYGTIHQDMAGRRRDRAETAYPDAPYAGRGACGGRAAECGARLSVPAANDGAGPGGHGDVSESPASNRQDGT